MIDLIKQGIQQYASINNVYRDDIKIYIHPIVKRYLERELAYTYTNYVIHVNNDIIVSGVRIVEGYDLKNIVISSPSLYNREPLVINLDELINL